MPKVRMLTTAASPERILLRGKVYNLQKAEAEELVGSSHGGVAHAAWAGPEEKPLPIPAQPDPGDVPETEDDDEDDEE